MDCVNVLHAKVLKSSGYDVIVSYANYLFEMLGWKNLASQRKFCLWSINSLLTRPVCLVIIAVMLQIIG